jgi:hypothetical protein
LALLGVPAELYGKEMAEKAGMCHDHEDYKSL